MEIDRLTEAMLQVIEDGLPAQRIQAQQLLEQIGKGPVSQDLASAVRALARAALHDPDLHR